MFLFKGENMEKLVEILVPFLCMLATFVLGIVVGKEIGLDQRR